MEEFDRKTIRKWVWGLIGIFLILSVVGSAFNWGSAFTRRVFNPNTVVENYEWFHEAVRDAEALNQQVIAALKSRDAYAEMAGPSENWKFDTRTEYSRLNSVVLGLENRRTSLVAEYNARSAMMNRSLFKDRNLPEQLY